MNAPPRTPNGHDPRRQVPRTPQQTPPQNRGRSYAPPVPNGQRPIPQGQRPPQTGQRQTPPPQNPMQRQIPQRQRQNPHPQNGQMPQNRPPLTPEQIARRRAAIEARREAERRARRTRLITLCIFGIALLVLIAICIRACTRDDTTPTGNTDPDTEETAPPMTTPTETEPETEPIRTPETPTVARPQMTSATEALSADIHSTYAALISLKSNTVLAARSANTRMHPASMTKVMSLIVAYEHIENLDDTFTVTSAIIDPVYTAGASLAGFSPNETVPLRDLLYGMILPSGAEASVALAEHVAGSEAAFVDLMNAKAAEIGLTDTHFENCTGLTGTNHYSTAVEMAMILAYAMQYEECAEILSTYQYTTTPTEKHLEGILLESTMFSRMYGDEPDGVTIIAGKTGYTDRARHCLMSYAIDDVTGEAYIFVSADNSEKFGPVFDAIEAYSAYAESDGVPVNADQYLP